MTEQTLPDNEGGLLITEPGGVLFTSRGYCAFGDACANGYLAQMRFSVGTSTKRLRGYGTCIVMVTSVFTEKIPRSLAECATLGCDRQDVIACATPITTFTVSCAGPSRYISRWMEWGSRRVYLFVFVWVCVPPSPFWPNKRFR